MSQVIWQSETVPTAEVTLNRHPLPVGSIDTLAVGYWGMIGFIATEAALCIYLEFSYYYYAVQPHTGPWPPGGAPDLRFALPATIALLLNGVVLLWVERLLWRGRMSATGIGLIVAFLLGIAFVALEALDWQSLTFGLSSGSYSSLFFGLEGIHMAHAVAGLLMLLPVIAWTLLGYFDAWRNTPVRVVAVYWYFVDVAWFTVFFALYISPRLGLIWHGAAP
jgi:heme/copper-type cytochrome/quinol oxidase subunit 3